MARGDEGGDYARAFAAVILEVLGRSNDIALLRRAELRIRQELGGQRVYIRHAAALERARSNASLGDISSPQPRA